MAEVLTKQWLMGVRRGWLHLLDAHPKGWAGIFESIQELITFNASLQEQVMFVRRTPYSSHPTMTDHAKVSAAFKAIDAALKDKMSAAKHWHNASEGNGGPSFPIESGDHMRARFETNFSEMMTVYVSSRPSKNNRWQKTRETNITELVDDLLALLRSEAERLKNTIEKDEASGISETKDKFSDPIYKTFDLYGMKVVHDDQSMGAHQFEAYVRLLDETYHRLKAKRLEKAWYGTIFIKCQTCGGENTASPGAGVGGHYHIGPDTISIYSRPSPGIVGLIAHELGHRYWFRSMTQSQRGRFESIVKVHTRVRPSKEKINLIPDSVVKTATDRVSKTLEFIASEIDRFLQDTGTFEEQRSRFLGSFHKLKSSFRANLEAACYTGSKHVDKEAHKALDESVLRFRTQLRTISDLFLQPPDDFERSKSDWVEQVTSIMDEIEAGALICINSDVQEHNKAEEAKKGPEDKAWEQEYENDPRPVEPVSDYGKSNIDEAFAEVFMHYVVDRDMTRDQLESFRSVLSYKRPQLFEAFLATL